MAVSPASVQGQVRLRLTVGGQWWACSDRGMSVSSTDISGMELSVYSWGSTISSVLVWAGLLVLLAVLGVVGLVVVLVDSVMVPVGVVMGILVSTGVTSDTDTDLADSAVFWSWVWKPSGGSGILSLSVSQSCSLPPARNQAGNGFLVVGLDLGTQP